MKFATINFEIVVKNIGQMAIRDQESIKQWRSVIKGQKTSFFGYEK